MNDQSLVGCIGDKSKHILITRMWIWCSTWSDGPAVVIIPDKSKFLWYVMRK